METSHNPSTDASGGLRENVGEVEALSVTTVGALLASVQGSALLIALPDIMTTLHAGFFTITIVSAQWKAVHTLSRNEAYGLAPKL